MLFIIRIDDDKTAQTAAMTKKSCLLDVMWEYSCWKFDSCLIYLHVIAHIGRDLCRGDGV